MQQYHYHMGLDATNPVFGVSDKARLKPVSSATASLDMILSKKQITKALIRLRRCAGWSAPVLFATTEDRFSRVEAHMDLNATKPVFGVSDKVRFKPVCSVIET